MLYGVLVLIFFLPLAVSAQVMISEIMYDLEGTDSKREWIEILNTGSESVDLSGWRLFENDTNHKLSLIQENGVLPAGMYAIIADNADSFLTDWTGFSGVLYDSSFSLKNTGELLEMRDNELNIIDSVTYASLSGAAGDGSSLQKVGGDWIAAFPTPGKANEASVSSGESGGVPQINTEENNTENTVQDNSSAGSSNSSFPVEPQIFAYAGEDRTVIVGADSLFEGQALGLKKEPLLEARYLWNFGNGETGERRRVLHHYSYPGDYIVILNVSSGKFAASDRVEIKAVPANVDISNVDSEFIELWNKGSSELTLSWWRLQAGSDRFTIPENTIVLPKKKIIFSSAVTQLTTNKKTETTLLYPNGVVAYEYKKGGEEEVVVIQASFPQPQTETTRTEKIVEKQPPEVAEAEPLPPRSVVPSLAVDTETQIAAPTVAQELPQSKSIFTWLLALFGIIGIAVIAAATLKKNSKTDEIKILE